MSSRREKQRVKYLLMISILALVFLVASDCAAAVRRTESGYEFTYEDPGAAAVNLVGSFNGWNQNATPMTRDESGVWRVTLPLQPGKHEYKFMVNGSDWIADPENPVVVGDYGNSGLEIDAAGEIVVSLAAPKFSNTPLSSKVALNGNFRSTYASQSDVAGDPKYRLTRPEHEFNLDVNIRVNESVTGTGRIKFNTSLGDIQETQGRLHSGRLDLLASPFDLGAYYHTELLSFDDPLELVGHEDLEGTIREEHIYYGLGTQGAVISASAFGADGLVFYTNVYDFDRFNDPSVYDNSDTDLIGARLTRDFGEGRVRAGLSWLRKQNGWWVDFVSGTNHSTAIDSFKSQTGSESDWFEIGTVDQTIAGDVRIGFADGLLGWLEFGWWNWSARWDVGNRERYEGTNRVNGEIDIPVGDDSGYRLKALVEGERSDELSWRLSHEVQRYDAMGSGELYVDFRRPAFADSSVSRFVGINDVADLWIEEFPALPERKNDITELDLILTAGFFRAELEIDRTGATRTYLAGGNPPMPGRFTQTNERWRIAPGISSAFFKERLLLSVDYEYVQNEPEGAYFRSFPLSDTYEAPFGLDFFNTRELILSGRLGLVEGVAALWDVRWMSYWANEGQVPADENVYASPYLALVYTPTANVELRLGYHINPVYYRDVPFEGRGNGRRIWRDEYIWEHGGSVFDAERALSDVRMVSLMGAIKF
ncbi:MAG: glycogen-binding domain-containing protein [Candidatus Eiseniibacteriota bacterium]|nr:MAG: glycogen-binding domain-containing protein [Candidatus Eisenbacteria bacterium]